MEIQIFHHTKIYNLQKHPLNILQDIIITLQLTSGFNTSQDIIFQTSWDKNQPIIIT
jgi:hypothetical protein